MIKNTRKWIIYGAFIASFSVLLCGCGKRDSDESPPPEKDVPVFVRHVTRGDVVEIITVIGEVHPRSSVLLTSKVPGRLERLSIIDEKGETLPLVEGVRVQKGGELALIDQAVYQAQLRSAKGAAQFAKAHYEDALREEKRMQSLVEDGAITAQMRDRSVTARALSAAALMQAEAALELAMINMDEASPNSPMDGVVVAKYIDEGNIVTPGTPIVSIQDISEVRVVFNVPSRYLGRINANETKVVFSSEVFKGGSLDAVVSSVHPVIEKTTRTLPVEARVDNKEGKLVAGMFLRVAIEVEKKENVLLIRDAELVKNGERIYVYIIKDGKAVLRFVEIGISENDLYEVVSGLNDDELVVTRGQHILKDGDSVHVLGEDGA